MPLPVSILGGTFILFLIGCLVLEDIVGAIRNRFPHKKLRRS